jgi:hypothetical protein
MFARDLREIADGEDSAVAAGVTIDEPAVVLSVPVRDQSVRPGGSQRLKITFPHRSWQAAYLGLVILQRIGHSIEG